MWAKYMKQQTIHELIHTKTKIINNIDKIDCESQTWF